MRKNNKISASMEDYLEAIYHAVQDKGAAQTKDIAARLNVKAGSVTGALQNLQKSGYINYAPYELITLTESGFDRARSIARKHEVLKEFFGNILGVEHQKADEAACRVEHSVGDEIIDRLVYFIEVIQAESAESVKNVKRKFHNTVAC